MNAPERYEFIVLPDGVPKLTLEKDTKVPNAATVVIQREDHTIGNLLSSHMRENPSVLYSGYRVQHPLQPMHEIKVQTKPETTPQRILSDTLSNLIVSTGTLESSFAVEVRRFKEQSFGGF